MENEFVPYQPSLDMKELGFNEPCFGLYHNDKTFYLTQCKSHEQFHGQICLAPTFSQCFRFFREKYNLKGFIGFRPNTKQFACHIYDMSLSGKEYVKQRTMEEFNKDPKVGTYEEAELYCLIKLIEIVKNK
jgi:hypothetical protein